MSTKTTKAAATTKRIVVPESPIGPMTDAQLVAQVDQLEGMLTEARDQLEVLAAETKQAQLVYEQARSESDRAANIVNSVVGRIDRVKGEQLRRTAPFVRGDIVVDDQGVRYRVYGVVFQNQWSRDGRTEQKAGEVHGVRLLKSGAEAYAKPRVILSSKPLTKVTD